MDFLYLLEKIRMPGLNELMLAVTELGGELPFLVIALIVFWCVDKRRGYYVLSVGFLGTLTNQFMKLWFRVPRPWVLDPEFTILEQAREAATGYSFPSGHTQNAVGTFGALTVTTKKKWIRCITLALAVLVPFSRMYVGVHTPKDVLVAAGMAVLFLAVMYPVVFGKDGKYIPAMLAVMTVLAAVFLCFVEFYSFPADIDPHNLESGVKNAYTLVGSLTGLIIVYFVEEKYEAGVALMGTEIKSIRRGAVNLKDSYCSFEGGEMFATGVHISPYEQGNRFNHIPFKHFHIISGIINCIHILLIFHHI